MSIQHNKNNKQAKIQENKNKGIHMPNEKGNELKRETKKTTTTTNQTTKQNIKKET